MMEPTKTSSQPKPATSSPSPSPSNAGDTDPSASTSASTPTPTPTPTLGGILPELKAHVLDYLPYETLEVALPMLDPDAEKDRGKVDSAGNSGGDADASKKKSNGGVAGAVTTLNITSGTQLDGSLTSKFPNVKEVNCLSFLRAADDSPVGKRIVVICRETATRLVPVLSSFSKLRRIYVGGGFAEVDENGIERLVRKEYYNRWGRDRLGNDPNLSLASSLAYQLIGALKARVIPPLERMDGVPMLLDDTHLSEDPQDMCVHCRDACYHLPIEEIAYNGWSSSCVDKVVLIETIAERDGKRTKELLCDPGGWCVVYMWEMVHDMLWDCFDLGSGEDSVEAKELTNRLQGLGVEGNSVRYMHRSSLNFIDRMIAAGWHPDARSSWYCTGASWIRSGCCIAKGTYDALVSRGIFIDESDNVVVDEMVEPALRDLPALTNRSMHALTSARG